MIFLIHILWATSIQISSY